jgi:ubiquinone/menaquinone biosynthesis C-methylase UbiE
MTLKITPEIEEYIKMQRTGYGNADIARCYEKDINGIYLNIEKHLPQNAQSVLDIGCGVGGIDLEIYTHYDGNIRLNLLDYSEMQGNYYGFNSTGGKYNHLGLTELFLDINGVKRKNIRIYDANNGYPSGRFDIIISLISCGFHYPVQTYLEKIKESRNGIVILDIRKGTGQIEILRDNFNSVETIAEFTKCERVLLK